MKKAGFILLLGCFATAALAQKNQLDGLMTVNDVANNASSNITLINHTGSATTVSALFIASFDAENDGRCASCSGGIIGGDNLGGAVATPVVFQNNQKIAIGQNFLYNMIYNGIYYIKNNIGSPCELPGCSWPGDDPASVRGWCITINATSLNSNYTYSHYQNGSNPPATVPAYSAAGNSTPFNYQYDLINPATLGSGSDCIGPIVCNDKTLTCTDSQSQSETLAPY